MEDISWLAYSKLYFCNVILKIRIYTYRHIRTILLAYAIMVLEKVVDWDQIWHSNNITVNKSII